MVTWTLRTLSFSQLVESSPSPGLLLAMSVWVVLWFVLNLCCSAVLLLLLVLSCGDPVWLTGGYDAVTNLLLTVNAHNMLRRAFLSEQYKRSCKFSWYVSFSSDKQMVIWQASNERHGNNLQFGRVNASCHLCFFFLFFFATAVLV